VAASGLVDQFADYPQYPSRAGLSAECQTFYKMLTRVIMEMMKIMLKRSKPGVRSSFKILDEKSNVDNWDPGIIFLRSLSYKSTGDMS